MKRIIAILLFSIICAAPVTGRGPGSTSFDFLVIPSGGRESGIGSATAVSHGANAVWWNPAGLGYLERATLSLAYNSWIDGVTRQRAGWSFLMPDRAAGAVNLMLHSVTGIDGYDWFGTPTSELKAASYLLSYSQAKRFTNYFSGGLSLKAVIEVLDDESAVAVAIDAGALFEPLDNSWFSLGFRNLGISGSFIDESEKLPLTIFTGLGMQINRFMLLASDAQYLDGQMEYGAGIEANIWNLLFFRGGWSSLADISDSFHLGVGWRFRDLIFDYAYTPYGDLGTTHRAEMTFEFGKPPLIEVLYRNARRMYSRENYREAFLEFNKVYALDSNYRKVRSWLDMTREKFDPAD